MKPPKTFSEELESSLVKTINELLQPIEETYAIAKQVKTGLEAEHEKASKNFGAVRTRLMGDQKAGPMSLTPDHVKFHPDYQKAKNNADAAFNNLRTFNGHFMKKYKKEYAAEPRAFRNKPVSESEGDPVTTTHEVYGPVRSGVSKEGKYHVPILTTSRRGDEIRTAQQHRYFAKKKDAEAYHNNTPKHERYQTQLAALEDRKKGIR